MKKVVLSLIFVTLLCVVAVHAEESYTLPLLAVQEVNGELQGSTAQLTLELQPGTGRIFLDTTPLTKLDTQVSTRFANDVACDQFNLPCSQYDFIYTIDSGSSIIGGPSAGAALAALTTIAVLDLEYDPNVAITGTINSGGTVGPVGGVQEKLEAAAKKYTVALVPLGATTYATNFTSNQTLDLIAYAKENLSLTAYEVADLDEVLYYLTGQQLRNTTPDFFIDPSYQELMHSVQEQLCERTQELEQKDIALDEEDQIFVNEQKQKGRQAQEQGDDYSAASFCFTVNIQLQQSYYQHHVPTPADIETLQEEIQQEQEEITKIDLTTISDLQTVMIVKERLHDAEELITQAANVSNTTEQANLLGYAEERFVSAQVWKTFFSMEGKQFIVTPQKLNEVCTIKLAEADERKNYAELFLGDIPLAQVGAKITAARKAEAEGESELCIILAAQAKADASAVLSSLGVTEDHLTSFLTSKKAAVERTIARNSVEGVFPILGYSYYQYATSLQDEAFTPLVYYEYALEMSDLEIYFAEDPKPLVFSEGGEKWDFWQGFLLGFAVGIVVILSSVAVSKRKK